MKLNIELIISNDLLLDRSTGKNIVWATDMYNNFGSDFGKNNQMHIDSVISIYNRGLLVPRLMKSKDEQLERSKKNGEVFTPSWIINKMNNFCDEQWFGSRNVFNIENSDNTWTTTKKRIEFKKEESAL